MAAEAERSPLVAVPPMAPDVAVRLLAPPWLPAAAVADVARACRARALVVPVRLDVPPALGLRLARALHARSGGGGPLLAATDDRPELRALPLGATVVLELARLDPAGRLVLETLLDDGMAWVLAVCDPAAALEDPIGTRLRAVALELAGLATRSAELPAIAAAVLAELTRRAGRAAAALSAAACARLTRHEWRDVVELEGVLARALASTDGGTIEVEHLGLDPRAVEPAASPDPRSPAVDARLEMLLAEISHELLNPLSTVKTFTSMAPRMLADAELPALAGHADEAVDRVQALFRNVLEFAQLGAPRRAPVDVGPVLDRLLAEMAPELAERAVRVRRTGDAQATCAGDPEQLEYALRNLVAGVVREVPAREEVVVDTGANGVVRVRLAAGDAAAKRLRRLLAPDAAQDLADPTLLPLSFTIARAVLERNGATLGVLEEVGGPTTLVVRLPMAVGMG